MRALLLIVATAACSPVVDHSNGGVDAPGVVGDPCNAGDTRCAGATYQTCVNGGYANMENCANACTASGCAACDPAAGNTCSGDNIVACNPDGTFGATVMACGAGKTCSNATCSNACTADGVDLVYVVDEANDFLSFDPRKLPGDPFVKIGTLNCPTSGGSIQQPPGMVMPFSMSVDRDGKAWVEYTSGEVFNVSLTDASCTASGYVPQAAGMALFGMGFVSDTVGANTEKLYIAGGGHAAEAQGKLAFVDTHGGNLTPQQTGNIAAASDFSPELTGTSEAKLYGFFPVLATPAYVQEVDRSTGAAVGQKYNLGASGLGTNIRDWAFAQWGGVFYVFVTTVDQNGANPVSKVHAIDRATGAYSVVKSSSPYQVDGAGVSTCAPAVLQ